jgi:sacsin
MKASFQGTLFRFPLRSTEQASSSRLSRQSYTEDDILSLFAQLYQEAVYNLLFLKNVVSLEMYVWESGMTEPKIVYSCSLGSKAENLSWHRQALIRFSGSHAESSSHKVDSFSMDFISEAYLGNEFEKKRSTYFIAQGMAPALSKIGIFATAAAKEYDLHLLPWASVAACISEAGLEVIPRSLSFSFQVLAFRLPGCLFSHVNFGLERFFPPDANCASSCMLSGMSVKIPKTFLSHYLGTFCFFQYVFFAIGS